LASAWSAPAARIAAVTATSRSPLLDSGTPNGSTSHGDAQLATTGGEGTRAARGPGTVALAAAMAAADSPARRTDAFDRSGTAQKPQLEPTSARTPRPASSPWFSASISPLRASIDSVRRRITRASAYVAPAGRA